MPPSPVDVFDIEAAEAMSPPELTWMIREGALFLSLSINCEEERCQMIHAEHSLNPARCQGSASSVDAGTVDQNIDPGVSIQDFLSGSPNGRKVFEIS